MIAFKGLMNLYKKCTTKQYSFLMIDTTRKNIKTNHET